VGKDTNNCQVSIHGVGFLNLFLILVNDALLELESKHKNPVYKEMWVGWKGK
jgi:hypothetical protein